ncbi:hypothetical protein U9M48_021371, partial [Paspalum notatum var. saurae]
WGDHHYSSSPHRKIHSAPGFFLFLFPRPPQELQLLHRRKILVRALLPVAISAAAPDSTPRDPGGATPTPPSLPAAPRPTSTAISRS